MTQVKIMSTPQQTTRPKQRRGRPKQMIPYAHQHHPTVISFSSWVCCCAIVIFTAQLSCHLWTTDKSSPPSWLVAASDDDYYNENFDDDGGNNQYYNNYNNQQQQQDDNNNKNDDKNNNNDDKENGGGAAVDDAAAAEYYANQYNGQQNQKNHNGDDYASGSNQNDAYKQERNQYQNADDDTFHWNANVGFGGVSVMPVSCINYNNGHMIKFQLFDTENSYQCHFAEISTFVVSIAHYMRAYFNYQALTYGKEYVLPEDAAFLNCIQLSNSGENFSLYAKIGCMERETFTSTKLQLRVYTDAQCSQPYDDGRSVRQHATRGYMVGENEILSEVSFKVPFYSCITCSPEQMSGTFNKKNGNWYDDDYISIYGKQQNKNNNGGGYGDDKYMAVNDDVGNGKNQNNDDDGRRVLYAVELAPAVNTYADEFWRMFDQMQRLRSLYDNYYDIGEWNMCQRIYKYGMWCDEECRSLDFFRTDQWSGSDVFLLSIMCTFLSGMMLLIVAKRLKAQQKARMYGDDQPLPGLPPFGMAIIFCVIMAVVITLAKLRFVNETLVFAVVTCILLFIYMLKLTLFENRRPVLLAAPRHDIFDNPLDDHLFD